PIDLLALGTEPAGGIALAESRNPPRKLSNLVQPRLEFLDFRLQSGDQLLAALQLVHGRSTVEMRIRGRTNNEPDRRCRLESALRGDDDRSIEIQLGVPQDLTRALIILVPNDHAGGERRCPLDERTLLAPIARERARGPFPAGD